MLANGIEGGEGDDEGGGRGGGSNEGGGEGGSGDGGGGEGGWRGEGGEDRDEGGGGGEDDGAGHEAEDGDSDHRTGESESITQWASTEGEAMERALGRARAWHLVTVRREAEVHAHDNGAGCFEDLRTRRDNARLNRIEAEEWVQRAEQRVRAWHQLRETQQQQQERREQERLEHDCTYLGPSNVASLSELAVLQLQSQHERQPRSKQVARDQQLAQQEHREAEAATRGHATAHAGTCERSVTQSARQHFGSEQAAVAEWQQELEQQRPQQPPSPPPQQQQMQRQQPLSQHQRSDDFSFCVHTEELLAPLIRPRPRRAGGGLRRCRCGDGLPRQLRASYFHHRDDHEGCMRLHAPPSTPVAPQQPAATPQVESTAPPAVPQVSTQRPTWYQRARDAVGTLLRGLPPLRGGRVWVPWWSLPSAPSMGGSDTRTETSAFLTRPD